MIKWQKMLIHIGFITAIVLIAGCTSSSPQRIYKLQTSNTGEQIVHISKQLIGSPYRYGGESPSGFDCSGLVSYIYRELGISVPRSSRQLHKQSHKVSLGSLQPGDLVFFAISKNKISHVGIYASEKQFIHAPSSGKRVSMASLDNPYWEKRLIGAGRFH
jgi:cell wall-associated NlpC family hydrolase